MLIPLTANRPRTLNAVGRNEPRTGASVNGREQAPGPDWTRSEKERRVDATKRVG